MAKKKQKELSKRTERLMWLIAGVITILVKLPPVQRDYLFEKAKSIGTAIVTIIVVIILLALTKSSIDKEYKIWEKSGQPMDFGTWLDKRSGRK